MTDEQRIANAKHEAIVVAKMLSLVQGRASGHGDIKFGDVVEHGTTIVYKRDGKTFHLVVHDMTGIEGM